jgi:NADPH:quinone reductase-like Zn-dependent oxidoreductase
MKAIVRQVYGPPEVLKLEEVVTPQPTENEVLVRICAASINLGDWELLTGHPRFISVLAHFFSSKQQYQFAPTSVTAKKAGMFSPKAKILGTDIAGRIEAVGKNVTQFQVGDEIFGMTERFGAFAEYVCVAETAPMVKKPKSISFEQAAALPQATHIALQAIRDKAQVQSGQTVLVNGAGGGAGTLAVQFAKMYGAEVTGVDGPTKLEMLRNIGADHVIDYTQEDFNRNGKQYDAILDMAAYRNIFESRRSLAASGIYLMGGGSGTATWQSALLGPVISRLDSRRIEFLLAESRRQDLIDIGNLFEEGKITPILDHSYPLQDAGAALRRVGEKQGIGKVIILP